jgi:hypothetical protein
MRLVFGLGNGADGTIRFEGDIPRLQRLGVAGCFEGFRDRICPFETVLERYGRVFGEIDIREAVALREDGSDAAGDVLRLHLRSSKVLV